jgi:hypothetical protein
MALSLNREEKLLRGGPKRVGCLPRRLSVAAAPCTRGTIQRHFQAQRVERTFCLGASHLIGRHTSNRSFCADIR